MKKTLLCALASAIGFAGAKTFLISRNYDMDALAIMNVEALSENELPGSWRSNFTIGTVWYTSDASIAFKEPLITLGWSTMRCCLTSCDANACDFSKEDEKCATHAVRGPH